MVAIAMLEQGNKIENLTFLIAYLIWILIRQVFEEEAKEISLYLRGKHHSSKVGHNQIHYAETVNKLCELQKQMPQSEPRNKVPHPCTSNFGSTETGFKLKAYQDKMSAYVATEKDINQRKREYNREVGRTAIVNQVKRLRS